ncbi:MarR family winged helix-turn-helix transcriptional regulator [Chloroflexota bacterium]
MAQNEEMVESYNLWVLLSRTRNAMWKARQFELNKYNISVVQAAALMVIHAFAGQATPSDIARWLFQEPHSISELISRMEKIGLVKKVKDPIKKQRVRISLTDKGREIYLSKSSKTEMMYKIISCLSYEEREQLSLILQKLLNTSVKELALEHSRDLPSI